MTIRIRFGLERTLTSVQFDKFGSIFYANNITVHTFFLLFICAGSHFIRNGILTYVDIEDLAGDACEFDNMSNDREHPAEPSISLLIVSTLSPCHFLVLGNLNRLDQEKRC